MAHGAHNPLARRTHHVQDKMAFCVGAPSTLVVRAATHVNPKATKHHTKTRPIKVRAGCHAAACVE